MQLGVAGVGRTLEKAFAPLARGGFDEIHQGKKLLRRAFELLYISHHTGLQRYNRKKTGQCAIKVPKTLKNTLHTRSLAS